MDCTLLIASLLACAPQEEAKTGTVAAIAAPAEPMKFEIELRDLASRAAPGIATALALGGPGCVVFSYDDHGVRAEITVRIPFSGEAHIPLTFGPRNFKKTTAAESLKRPLRIHTCPKEPAEQTVFTDDD